MEKLLEDLVKVDCVLNIEFVNPVYHQPFIEAPPSDCKVIDNFLKINMGEKTHFVPFTNIKGITI